MVLVIEVVAGKNVTNLPSGMNQSSKKLCRDGMGARTDKRFDSEGSFGRDSGAKG